MRDPGVVHLFNRIAFGGTQVELDHFQNIGIDATLQYFLNYEDLFDAVDAYIGQPGFVSVTPSGGTNATFSPNTNINDARQRWLFRMLHSPRWLEEKMTLFWHHHFATGYRKVSSALGAVGATRAMAAKRSEDPGGMQGQIELLRQYATGSFRDLLIEISKDVAMLVWLDGRQNTKAKPQENYGREIMELFTVGVGNYVETDVYAAARVFTGWNLRRVGASDDPAMRWEFVYNANQHELSPKTFSFPIYADGTRTIPARTAANGWQDGVDLINAIAFHPATARRLATKLYGFFVSDRDKPDSTLVDELAAVYLQNNTLIKPVLQHLFSSPQFAQSLLARYSWPAEFVIHALKDFGYVGFSVRDALTPLANMGQQLFEPPDVAGWELGPGWFSPGMMLARMNFATQMARNQRTNLVGLARSSASSPESLLASMLYRMNAITSTDTQQEFLTYLRAGGAWTGSDSQLGLKVPAVARMIATIPAYHFV